MEPAGDPIGMLPGHSSVGPAVPILLVLMRVSQGLASSRLPEVTECTADTPKGASEEQRDSPEPRGSDCVSKRAADPALGDGMVPVECAV